jgi:Flp pilus assembly protein TadD
MTHRNAERTAVVPVTVGAIVLMLLLVAGMAGPVSAGTTKKAPSGGGTAAADQARAEQHVNQGMTYIKMKDYDNAIIEFTRATDLIPNYAVAYSNRGVAYMQQRKFNKAMDDLSKAVGLTPGDKSIHYNLTALYCLQGAKDRAFDSLDKALELGFNNYDALRNDPDLDGIRDEVEFRKILEKHKVFIR